MPRHRSYDLVDNTVNVDVMAKGQIWSIPSTTVMTTPTQAPAMERMESSNGRRSLTFERMAIEEPNTKSSYAGPSAYNGSARAKLDGANSRRRISDRRPVLKAYDDDIWEKDIEPTCCGSSGLRWAFALICSILVLAALAVGIYYAIVTATEKNEGHIAHIRIVMEDSGMAWDDALEDPYSRTFNITKEFYTSNITNTFIDAGYEVVILITGFKVHAVRYRRASNTETALVAIIFEAHFSGKMPNTVEDVSTALTNANPRWKVIDIEAIHTIPISAEATSSTIMTASDYTSTSRSTLQTLVTEPVRTEPAPNTARIPLTELISSTTVASTTTESAPKSTAGMPTESFTERSTVSATTEPTSTVTSTSASTSESTTLETTSAIETRTVASTPEPLVLTEDFVSSTDTPTTASTPTNATGIITIGLENLATTQADTLEVTATSVPAIEGTVLQDAISPQPTSGLDEALSLSQTPAPLTTPGELELFTPTEPMLVAPDSETTLASPTETESAVIMVQTPSASVSASPSDGDEAAMAMVDNLTVATSTNTDMTTTLETGESLDGHIGPETAFLSTGSLITTAVTSDSGNRSESPLLSFSIWPSFTESTSEAPSATDHPTGDIVPVGTVSNDPARVELALVTGDRLAADPFISLSSLESTSHGNLDKILDTNVTSVTAAGSVIDLEAGSGE